MKKKIYQVDAFTSVAYAGNPAGVVLEADGLLPWQMIKIAKEMNLSETAFVFKGGKDYDYEVKFFTPTEEVDLCGHATIATFSLLKDLRILDQNKKTYIQKTKAGKLMVKLESDGSILMRQGNPQQIFKDINEKKLCKIMGLSYDHMGIGQVMDHSEIWTTGLKDILLPINCVDHLKNLSVDFSELSTFSREMDVVGVHAFAISAEGDIWSRNFAPAYDINEESATGTSNGALGACLLDKGYLDNKDKSFMVRQGDWMGSPSRIRVQVVKGEPDQVWVGGHGVTVIEGEMVIPSDKNIKV